MNILEPATAFPSQPKSYNTHLSEGAVAAVQPELGAARSDEADR
jgi:hypothetical protein